MTQTASSKVTITNRLGLHARPAMMLVDIAKKFQADITAQRTDQDEKVDGKSIMQIMMLAATQGTELEITAVGPDADDAVNEIVALIKSHFSEE